jgi:putative endonuclease
MGKGGFVYMMASPNKKALYTGVTSDLKGRIWEHRSKKYPESFTARYSCVVLVYFDEFPTIESAIEEEKRIKAGSRKRKEDLINAYNKDWVDLWEDVQDW